MALYHLSVKAVSRGGGRSAVACAAYRQAESLHDERTGQTHDYERKRGGEARLLMMPDGAGGSATMAGENWTAERERLWNAAEAAERRKDARVAREYELALPHELDAASRRRLVACGSGIRAPSVRWVVAGGWSRLLRDVEPVGVVAVLQAHQV